MIGDEELGGAVPEGVCSKCGFKAPAGLLKCPFCKVYIRQPGSSSSTDLKVPRVPGESGRSPAVPPGPSTSGRLPGASLPAPGESAPPAVPAAPAPSASGRMPGAVPGASGRLPAAVAPKASARLTSQPVSSAAPESAPVAARVGVSAHSPSGSEVARPAPGAPPGPTPPPLTNPAGAPPERTAITAAEPSSEGVTVPLLDPSLPPPDPKVVRLVQRVVARELFDDSSHEWPAQDLPKPPPELDDDGVGSPS